MPKFEVGRVTSFFAHPVVAGVTLTARLTVGDELHIVGNTTDIRFVVDSMQIDNANVDEASQGEDIGIKVPERGRRGDRVYKITG